MSDLKEVTLFKFSNRPTSPYLDSLLAMFYSAASNNQIGIMEGWDLNTNKESLILVGIEMDENGKPDCYPIAKCLSAEEVSNFLAPDGQGGYFDPSNPTELAEYKDRLNTVEAATVEEPTH